jgi:hypothetical protein
MAERREQTTVRETEASADGSQQVVRQSTARSDHADTKMTAGNVVYYVLGVIEVFLGLRFILKLLGANPGSGFVDFVYAISGVFAAPFENIFSSATAEGVETTSVFEPAILVAALVYWLLAWGIVKLMSVNEAKRV